MNQNANEKQNYAFSVTIENTSIGEKRGFTITCDQRGHKKLFDRLKIKMMKCRIDFPRVCSRKSAV